MIITETEKTIIKSETYDDPEDISIPCVLKFTHYKKGKGCVLLHRHRPRLRAVSLSAQR